MTRMLFAGTALLAALSLGSVSAQDTSTMTIAEVVAGNPDFSTLLTALKAAGLDETLAGEGPFTVFAPTNAAFAKIPKETLDGLLNDKEQLTKVLTYHVVPGKVMAADVMKMESADTVEKSPVKVMVDGDTVMINDATVTQADIEASNGVIHVIDTVLMPPAE
ncbi:fasciclin domain-containing protein [Deinococcus sp.]|uniref:fasciclin domain-containing protein n=1 Tax=Deinococcus sp. TaxID=47478 RepID=UPI003B5A7FE6